MQIVQIRWLRPWVLVSGLKVVVVVDVHLRRNVVGAVAIRHRYTAGLITEGTQCGEPVWITRCFRPRGVAIYRTVSALKGHRPLVTWRHRPHCRVQISFCHSRRVLLEPRHVMKHIVDRHRRRLARTVKKMLKQVRRVLLPGRASATDQSLRPRSRGLQSGFVQKAWLVDSVLIRSRTIFIGIVFRERWWCRVIGYLRREWTI